MLQAHWAQPMRPNLSRSEVPRRRSVGPREAANGIDSDPLASSQPVVFRPAKLRSAQGDHVTASRWKGRGISHKLNAVPHATANSTLSAYAG